MKCLCCHKDIGSASACAFCTVAGCTNFKQSLLNPSLSSPLLGPFETMYLKGRAASPGLAVGPPFWAVGYTLNWHTLMSGVKDGDILVAQMTTPDIIPVMPKIAGIVTLEGGITSHACLIAREFGIPAVVGLEWKPGGRLADTITVNGTEGEVILEKIKEEA